MGKCGLQVSRLPGRKVELRVSVIDTRLGFDSLAVGVLDLVYFADSIGQLDYLWMGVTARKYQMHQRRFVAEDFQDLLQVDQLELEGVVDFVEYHDIEPAGGHLLPNQVDGVLGIGTVLGPRVRVALDAAEALACGVQLYITVHSLDAVPLACIQISLHELDDTYLHSMAAGA